MDEVAEALEKYQGLVPLVYDVETMGLAEARPQDMPYAVYLKREADKVIADLDESHKKEVKQLLILNREQANSANRLRDSMEQVIRHHKYRRCLGEAKICQMRLERYERYLAGYIHASGPTVNRYKFLISHYEKWYKRWLALAEETTWAKFLQLIHKEAT